MRALFVASFAVAVCAAAWACDSFEPSAGSPDDADAGADSQTSDVSATPVDAESDQAAACPGEPEWATSASATTMTTCNGAPANLLTDPNHCGRCDHACGGQQCLDGNCAEKLEDGTAQAVTYGARNGAVYYSRRPAGQGDVVARLVPGQTPTVLGRLDADAGLESSILSIAVGDRTYVRTRGSIRHADPSAASDAVPALLTSEVSDEVAIAAITIGPDNKIYATQPSSSRIDIVEADGGIFPFAPGTSNPGETRFAGNRYIWLQQPFLFFGSSATTVWIEDQGNRTKLYDSADQVGGPAIDGDDLFVMRAGDPGAIMRVDIPTKTSKPFYEGELKNPPWNLVVAVDATHVYWLRSLDGLGANAEIWKRARCGGAAVRIGKHKDPNRLIPLGDRLYFGAIDGLHSIAK